MHHAFTRLKGERKMTNTTKSTKDKVAVDTATAADEKAFVVGDLATLTAITQASLDVRREIKALVAAKDEWESNAYRTSNEQLYTLLQKCYGFYKLICSDSAKAKKRVNDIDAYLESVHKYKASTSTHTLSKIVKAVFGADRRRVSAYSIALRAAHAANTSVADIPQFIRNSGGVEELRLAKSPNAKTAKQKAEAAQQTVDKQVIANIKIELEPENLDPAKVGTQHVLIVTQRADGAFDINALVSASSAVNAALAALYNQVKSQLTETETLTKQTRDDLAQSQRIEDAALSVLQ
jgi:hypothetical protein